MWRAIRFSRLVLSSQAAINTEQEIQPPPDGMSEVRTLGEVAARTSMLQIACPRCERPGALPARQADHPPRRRTGRQASRPQRRTERRSARRCRRGVTRAHAGPRLGNGVRRTAGSAYWLKSLFQEVCAKHREAAFNLASLAFAHVFHFRCDFRPIDLITARRRRASARRSVHPAASVSLRSTLVCMAALGPMRHQQLDPRGRSPMVGDNCALSLPIVDALSNDAARSSQSAPPTGIGDISGRRPGRRETGRPHPPGT
jgi:hypothetical protein